MRRLRQVEGTDESDRKGLLWAEENTVPRTGEWDGLSSLPGGTKEDLQINTVGRPQEMSYRALLGLRG